MAPYTQHFNARGGKYVTLPNLESIKGYTTTNGGTTVQYTSGLLISVTKNTTLYAVYKKTYTLKIYHDGSLYKNYSQYEGTTVTLPNDSNYDGYSTTNGGNKVYNNGTVITLEKDITLYGIKKKQEIKSITSSGGDIKTVYISQAQTITIETDGHYSNSSGAHSVYTNALQTNGNRPFIKINNNYLSSLPISNTSTNIIGNGTFQLDVSAGTTIEFASYWMSYSPSPSTGYTQRIDITIKYY